MVEYILKELAKLPVRAIPYIFCDANAKIGLVRDPCGGGEWRDGLHCSVGKCNPDMEDAAGTIFRSMLEKGILIAINTFVSSGSGPTFLEEAKGSKLASTTI